MQLPRPLSGSAIASLAQFLALGGTTIAAFLLAGCGSAQRSATRTVTAPLPAATAAEQAKQPTKEAPERTEKRKLEAEQAATKRKEKTEKAASEHKAQAEHAPELHKEPAKRAAKATPPLAPKPRHTYSSVFRAAFKANCGARGRARCDCILQHAEAKISQAQFEALGTQEIAIFKECLGK